MIGRECGYDPPARSAHWLGPTEAVALGLKQNLGGVVAADIVTDVREQRWQALSELLPNVVTDTGFGVHEVNVKAQLGITVPREPPILGPFGYFDSRAYLTESAFDWTSIERAVADRSEVESALSEPDAAKALVQQASDQRTTGLASAVDIQRSQVELQSREQKMIVAQSDLAEQKLLLARVIGLLPVKQFERVYESLDN